MTDLFAFGSAAKALDAEDRYGAAGDLKKTQYVMQLLGHPADADTLKCLIIAAEKGLELETRVLNIAAGEHRSEDYLRISPSGMMPALKEAHYQVCGDLGIVSFVEGRGLGNRMPPRNAEVLALQEYWVDIARSDAGPLVQRIVDAALFGASNGNAAEARSGLEPMLDALEKQLGGREYIVGPYSYADVHWTAYLHLLCIVGEGALIDVRPALSAWLARVRARKSFSGQNLVPYALLPSLEDIRAGRLCDVVITDY